MKQRLAIDIGGTFIDVIRIDIESGEMSVDKASSTPDNPSRGVIGAIHDANLSMDDIDSFVHGTTLGVNALLEREGAKVGIVTNDGFRDVFELGRYDVPDEDIYNFTYDKPEPLVPRRQRRGVPGRINKDGEIVEPLDEEALIETGSDLIDEYDVESLAVCFLHSYRNQEHEQRAKELLNEEFPLTSISISSDIVREHYEYERTSTTVLDGYIKPIFDSYVGKLEEVLDDLKFDGSFLVTRSGGGALPANSAADAPVQTILSGPAGGVIGASQIASLSDSRDLITMDMGGTSLESCVIDNGSPSITYESSLEHLPMLMPVFDIRTIGAGGGSIAWHDNGLLKVGPHSAGSDPGPICYGNGGTEPTLTDAAVELGYLHKDAFLGGDMKLDLDNVTDGIRTEVAEPLSLSVTKAATGIIDVTTNKQVSSIREITVEQGYDPRDFSILAFGGAGPMMAPLVGRELGVNEVIVPRVPAVFSAWGMLMADVVHDFSQTYLDPLEETDLESIEDDFDDLEREARETLSNEGYSPEQQRVDRSIEMRYHGQAHTVEIDGGDLSARADIGDRFTESHRERYGHNLDDLAEIVYLRVRGVGVNDEPTVRKQDSSHMDTARVDSRTMYCFSEDRYVDTDVYDRSLLSDGDTVAGPAIIQEPSSTTVLHSDQTGNVDDLGQIVINTAGSR